MFDPVNSSKKNSTTIESLIFRHLFATLDLEVPKKKIVKLPQPPDPMLYTLIRRPQLWSTKKVCRCGLFGNLMSVAVDPYKLAVGVFPDSDGSVDFLWVSGKLLWVKNRWLFGGRKGDPF